jgi:hypothetical protein
MCCGPAKLTADPASSCRRIRLKLARMLFSTRWKARKWIAYARRIGTEVFMSSEDIRDTIYPNMLPMP